MLAMAIIALPAENHFLFLPGFSILFVLFGAIALYVTLARFSHLLRILFHPVFLAGYAFLGFGFLMEVTHDNADYHELIRVAQMIIGAILVATLCRDWAALRAACYGYLAAGLYLALLLFMTSYGALSQATSSNFQEASQLRAQAFEVLQPIELTGMEMPRRRRRAHDYFDDRRRQTDHLLDAGE